MDEMIPAWEKMPDKSGEYLIWAKLPGESHFDYCICDYNKTTNSFVIFDEDDDKYIDFEGLVVKAWAELPKPPYGWRTDHE